MVYIFSLCRQTYMGVLCHYPANSTFKLGLTFWRTLIVRIRVYYLNKEQSKYPMMIENAIKERCI